MAYFHLSACWRDRPAAGVARPIPVWSGTARLQARLVGLCVAGCEVTSGCRRGLRDAGAGLPGGDVQRCRCRRWFGAGFDRQVREEAVQPALGQSWPAYAGDAEQRIKILIQDLLHRGIEDGTLRGDLTVDDLVFLLGSLLQAAARMANDDLAGVEKAAALITLVFLHGTASGQNKP